MSYSFTASESITFTVTHARHMAAKVSADLKRMQRFYQSPTDESIAQYEAEIVALRGQPLTVDIRETGTLDGVSWVGTPLANISGFARNVQRSIDVLLTTGGTVSLSAPIGISEAPTRCPEVPYIGTDPL